MPTAPPYRPVSPSEASQARPVVLAWKFPPGQPRRPSPLALWHLLSLDAPTVAAVWTWFIARCAGVTLPWTQPAAMFVAVWIIYATDRLLDARVLEPRLPRVDRHSRLSPGFSRSRQLRARPDAAAGSETVPRSPSALQELEARHHFHHRHRDGFLTAVLGAAVTLFLLLPHIGVHALRLYALLATLLAAWMLLIHTGAWVGASAGSRAGVLRSPASRRLPKELVVGLFFPAAVFIPTVARVPGLRMALLPAAVLLAAVCALNGLFLYAWEHAKPGLQAQQWASTGNPAHWTTRWATRHIVALAALLCAAACLMAFLGAAPGPAHRSARLLLGVPSWNPSLLRGPALACALATALLLVLHRMRVRVAAVHLRALADLVLLTPVLVWPLLAWPLAGVAPAGLAGHIIARESARNVRCL